MPSCYVPNCRSGNPNSVKRHFFGPPKNPVLREEWRKNIPREVPAIHKYARVCEVHFDESDLIKGNTFIINGKEVFLPMDTWRLKEGAVPRIFPGCPSYLSKPLKRRKPPIDRSEKRSKTEDTVVDGGTSIVIDDDLQQQVKTKRDINLRAVSLPSLSWCWLASQDGTLLRDETVTCAEIVCDGDSKTYPRRSLKLNLIAGTATYFILGALMKCLPSSWKSTFSSEDDVSSMLSNFYESKLCPGFPVSLFPGITMLSKYGVSNGQDWRSSNCPGVSQHPYKPCQNCRTLKYAMQRKKLRTINRSN